MGFRFSKTPTEVVDYSIDWSDISPDTISTSTFAVDTGITKDNETNDTTSSTVWVSGGTDGTDYQITNTITTAGGRTFQRDFVIKVRAL